MLIKKYRELPLVPILWFLFCLNLLIRLLTWLQVLPGKHDNHIYDKSLQSHILMHPHQH
nr:MAG TPA: hypothetical protein [Caudoviricetes sp.]